MKKNKLQLRNWNKCIIIIIIIINNNNYYCYYYYISYSVRNLWLRGDYFVRKLSAMGQPAKPTLPSVPPGSENGYQSLYLRVLQKWRPLTWKTMATCGFMAAGQSLGLGCGLDWTPALSVMHSASVPNLFYLLPKISPRRGSLPPPSPITHEQQCFFHRNADLVRLHSQLKEINNKL